MSKGNAIVIITCLGLLWSDLSSPGRFTFASPIAKLRSAAAQVKPAIGGKVKAGMVAFESVEFIAVQCPTKPIGKLSTGKIQQLAAAKPEAGLTPEAVQQILGLPDCADGSISQYFGSGGVLKVGYKSGKTTGFEFIKGIKK